MALIFSVIAAASVTGLSPMPHPITLNVDSSADRLVFQIVGQSARPMRAGYQLEVTGGTAGSTSRSVQQGAALLDAAKVVTLATVKLNATKGGRWVAKLHVTPADAGSYDVEWRSPE